MKATIKLILLSFVIMTSVGIWTVKADTEARRKARYYYTAAMREQALGNEPQAYEYYKKSYQMDSTYSEGALAYGNRRLYIGIDTLQSVTELNRSLSMMRNYVDSFPDDIYESLNYGSLAGQLGNTDEAQRVLERAYENNSDRSNILLELSEVYARANKLPEAISAIDRYELQEGMSAPITTRKLSFLLANNDTIGALSEATKLVASDPTDVSYYIIKANVYDIINMPDSAFVYYSKAESIDPESGNAKLALAGYYLNRGDSVSYDNKIYEVLLCEDMGLEQKADLIAQYLDHQMRSKSDVSRGDYLFSVLESQYPHEPRVLDLAARYSAAKGDLKKAIEHISYAIDLNPTNQTYWGQLMTYQSADKKPEDAIKTYERAKTYFEPDNKMTLYYASVTQMAKQYDKAIEIYKSLIDKIQPGLQVDSVLSLNNIRSDISVRDLDMLSQLLTNIGDAYNQNGEFEKSYRSYENAIVLDSSNSMAKNNYAYFLSLNGGDLDKALALSSEALEGEGEENPTYLDTYAWISYLKNDLETAEKYQLRAVEIIEKDGYEAAEIYDHLGDILSKLGKFDEAIQAWKNAVRIHYDLNEGDETELHETLRKLKDAESLVKSKS